LPEALLACETHGSPRETALLLVHPMGTDRRFWEECIALWRDRFYCVATDLANAGESFGTDSPVPIPRNAANLERLRKHLDIESVVAIGCALGSMVAACYAARYPRSTRALVMANPGVRNTDAADAMRRERAAVARASGMSALLPAAADRAFHQQPRDERYRRHLERYAAQDAATFARSVEGYVGADITDELSRIDCPTLLVSGEHDVLMPADAAQRIKEVVSRAEVVSLPGAAHFLPFQAPDRFARSVVAFLERHAIASI
jgi:pimeloyl-ACP methyl ester carboxylesterase